MEEIDVVNRILEEVRVAERIHPEWPDDIIHQVAIMNEESGESTQAALQSVYEDGEIDDVYKEVVQTAAMCIRILKNEL